RRLVPWGLACPTVVAAMVVLVLIVPVGFGIAIPKMLQGLTERQKAENLYTEFRARLQGISPVPLDEEYFPEEPERSAVFKYIRGGLDPQQPFILNALLRLAGYGGSWVW